MKIAFLVSDLSTGGAERVATLLANQWCASGHEVTMVLTYSGKPRIDFALEPGIRVVSMVDLMDVRKSRGIGWFSKVRMIAGLLRDIAPDLACSFLTNVNIAAIAAARMAGVPIVVSERSHPPSTPQAAALRLARILAYPFADKVVMQTRAGIDWARRMMPEARVTAIPNPVAIPLPNVGTILPPDEVVASERKLLLAIGRLHEQKRFLLLLQSFGRIAPLHADWDLVILGEGELRSTLHEQIEALGLVDRIRIPGRVGNLHDWYERADAFAMTSAYEGFPNALLEALAYGVPALACDCPTGPSELIEHEANGLLLPLDASAERLAEGLDELLAREWTRRTASGARILQSYAVTTIERRWIKLFKEVANSRA